MRLILIALFIALPYFSFAQGFKIKIGNKEYDSDKIPDQEDLPQRLNKFMIKKAKGDSSPKTYTVQVGEEEYTFRTHGGYEEVKFTHDIKGLVVSILDEKRTRQGKAFTLKKRK
jgi:hypothetical protein